MRKIVFIIPVLFLLLLSNVLAVNLLDIGPYTLITGTVYAFKINPGKEAPNARVEITCASDLATVVQNVKANDKGDFAAKFDKSICDLGCTIKIKATSEDGLLIGELLTRCSSANNCEDVVADVTDGDPVLTSVIPEFSALTAAFALVGACIGFIFLRRK